MPVQLPYDADRRRDPAPLDHVPDAPALVGAGVATAELVVVEGPNAGFRCPVAGPQIEIGRAHSADLRVSCASLSQRHAVLIEQATPHGKAHAIVDLQSTNGTFINGQRVHRSVLQPGARIRMGQVELIYHCGLMPVPEGALIPRGPHHGPNGGLALPPHGAVVYADRGPLAEVGTPEPDPWQTVIRVARFVRRNRTALVVGAVLGAALGLASYKFFKPPVTASFELSLVGQGVDNPIEERRRENFEFFRQPADTFFRPAVIIDALRATGDDDVTEADVAEAKQRLAITKRGEFLWAG